MQAAQSCCPAGARNDRIAPAAAFFLMPPVVFLTTAFFFLLPLAPAAALLALAAASFPAAPPALALRPAPRYAQISRVPVASLISLDRRPSPQLPPLTHTAHSFSAALSPPRSGLPTIPPPWPAAYNTEGRRLAGGHREVAPRLRGRCHGRGRAHPSPRARPWSTPSSCSGG